MIAIRGAGQSRRGRHRRGARRSGGHDLAFADVLAEFPERPFEDVSAGRAASEAYAGKFIEIRHAREIDIGVRRVESRRRPVRRTERADAEGKAGVAAVQF